MGVLVRERYGDEGVLQAYRNQTVPLERCEKSCVKEVGHCGEQHAA